MYLVYAGHIYIYIRKRPEASSTCAPGREHPHPVCEKMPDVTSQPFPETFIDLKADVGLIYKQNASHLRSKMRQIERFRCES